MQVMYKNSMGCNLSCMATDTSAGPMEIIFEDAAISISKPPRFYIELIEIIRKVIPSITSTDEIVIEYCSNDGIRQIQNDISLQEAYIMTGKYKLIVGVRLSKEYVPFELRQRGSVL